MPHITRRSLISGATLGAGTVLATAACTATGPTTTTATGGVPGTGPAPTASSSAPPTTSTPPQVPAVKWVSTPAAQAQNVPVDTRVTVKAENGQLTRADLTYVSKKGKTLPVEGWLESGAWTAKDLLEPGVTYTLTLAGKDSEGTDVQAVQTFATADLTLDDQIWVGVTPASGAVVGIGMPVIVSFDLPVLDKATFEKHMTVTSEPAQEGGWYWLSDREAHWRPRKYWTPGTKVRVEAALNGVPGGGNRFGEMSRVSEFTIGRSVIGKVNLRTHEMTVAVNGKVVRTIPISGGRPGWETRSGIKVIMEKFVDFTMKAESIGLKEGDKDFYQDVEVARALRITHSGEFLHSAPWSVSQQGRANVSHGCTGMSNANSIWLYDVMKVGDVVEYTGTQKWMTMGNGYADWNLSWDRWQAGSALKA